MSTHLPPSLRLADTSGLVVLALYGAGTTLVAILNLPGLANPLYGIISIALLWFALLTLAFPSRQPYGLPPTLVVLAVVCAVTALSAWNIVDPESPGYAAWHMGAMVFLLLVLALRGRRGLAWLGFSLFAAITVFATLAEGHNVLTSANNVARQSATLLIGTLFAIFLERAGRKIALIHKRQLTRAAMESAASAASVERSLQNARLERDARPALVRIVSDEPLEARDLRDFALLDASLRDGIRAAGLSGDVLAREVRAARNRGIHVVLLDDRGNALNARDRERVEEALISELRRAPSGTITARLNPHDRDEIATVVSELNGEYRRSVIARDGVDLTLLT